MQGGSWLLHGSWLGDICWHHRRWRQHCWSAMGASRLLHWRPETRRWRQLQRKGALQHLYHILLSLQCKGRSAGMRRWITPAPGLMEAPEL